MGTLVNILGPITIITLIGYALGRSASGLHARTLGTIVILVATPSLIFHTFATMQVGPETLGQMGLAAFLAVCISGGIALVGLLALGAPMRMYLPSLMLPNSGNMGLPLALLTFGDDGMRLAVSYFFVVSLVQHSVGFSLAAGTVDLRYLVRQPLLYAVVLVLLVTFLGLSVPQVILTTTEMLGAMMIPAMLILLGSSLATLTVSDIKPALAVAVARLLLGALSAVLVIWLLDLDGVAAGTVFILAAMPTAIVNFIYAERFNADAGKVAGAVVVSTLLTFLCLPIIIWLAIGLAA